MGRVPRGGGLEGRHAHGELEAHGGGGEEYGSCVRENDGCRDSRAMVCKEGSGGGRPARGHTGWSHGWSARVRVRAYRVASARNGRSVARSKVGESASCVGQWVGSVFFRAKSEKRSLARE